MATLQELRKLVRARHRAATKKISRMNRVVGVEVSGSKDDPRRNLKFVDKYTRAQLNKYLKQLDTFVDRKTQFVPDARRRPIPIAKWKEYKKVEADYNKKVKAQFDKVKHIKLPNQMTIEARNAMTNVAVPQMLNPSTNIKRSINRKSLSVSGERQLDILMMELKRRMTPQQRAKEAKRNRKIVIDMLHFMDDEESANRIAKLSTEQFEMLFDYSADFMNALSLFYENSKKLAGTPTKAQIKVAAQQNADLKVELDELISWAEQI